MYAIVKTGGKQYRVERGQRLLVERLTASEGSDVTLEPLLYRSDEAVVDKAGLAQVKVTARVVGHVRGPKLRVFKFKPKRGYKRRTGHRQELTQIEVTDISAKAASAKPHQTASAKAPEAASGKAPPPAAKAPSADDGGGGAKAAAAKPARAKGAGAKGAGAKPAGAKPAAGKPAAAKPAGAKPAAAKPKRAAAAKKPKQGDDDGA